MLLEADIKVGDLVMEVFLNKKQHYNLYLITGEESYLFINGEGSGNDKWRCSTSWNEFFQSGNSVKHIVFKKKKEGEGI